MVAGVYGQAMTGRHRWGRNRQVTVKKILYWANIIALILCSAAAFLFHKSTPDDRQFGCLYIVVMGGLIGALFLQFALYNPEGSFLFRRRTVKLFGETFCRVVEGILGALLLLGSLFFLISTAVAFFEPRVPGTLKHPVLMTMIFTGLGLIFFFTVMTFLIALTGTGVPFRKSSPPDESSKGSDENNFNF